MLIICPTLGMDTPQNEILLPDSLTENRIMVNIILLHHAGLCSVMIFFFSKHILGRKHSISPTYASSIQIFSQKSGRRSRFSGSGVVLGVQWYWLMLQNLGHQVLSHPKHVWGP